MKREEIIRDLVERSSDAGRGQYISIRCDVVREIVSLLREQEARVMTLEEIRTGEIDTLWIEVEGKPHIFPGIWYRRSKKDGIPAIDITLNTGIVRGTVVSYGYAWRCWTARPTPEQMRDTKWEGDSNAEVH